MNRFVTYGIGLSTVVGLFLNCKSNPCLTCKATLFRGASASVYLSTHPKPQKVSTDPRGWITYEWIYTREEAYPVGGGASSGMGAGAARTNPSVVSEFLGWLGTGMQDQQVHTLSSTQETYYFVTLTTDAQGVVQDYACSSLQLNVKPVSRL